jgi:hypothetical protein
MNTPAITDSSPAPDPVASGPAPTPSSSPQKTDKTDPTFGGVIGTVDVLSEAEAVKYRACDAVIQRVWFSFVEVGLALAQIRDEQLYRIDFTTFDAYCQARCELKHAHVYRLITAAQLFTSLAALADVPKPDHESQLRPLFGLTPPQAQLAWQYAAQKGCGRPITARLVKGAVKELQLVSNTPKVSRQSRPNKSEQRRLVGDAFGELLMLIGQKANYDVLMGKVEALHRQFQTLFAQVNSKR